MNLPHIFNQALISAYRENPCQVLPNALWKSLSWAEQFETDIKIDAGQVIFLKAWNQHQVMLFWQRDRFLHVNPFNNSPRLEFALLHQDFASRIKLEEFSSRKTYFRLIHNMNTIPQVRLSKEFRFAIADPLTETQEIAELIGACYDEIHPSPATVSSWSQNPIFAADLWIWVIDEAINRPVALGIAEFDPIIAEGSLEWIQVLPQYRRKGLAKQIVSELLNRLLDRAEFVTVSGKRENNEQPENLYRRCGFEGDDVWWVLKR